MGADRCGWVRWGAGGMGDTKTMYSETKTLVQSLIRALWPGKFPRTSCFTKQKQKWNGRLRMGKHGFAWMRWDVFALGDRKKRGNEAKIRDQDMFAGVIVDNKNNIQLAGVRWWKRISGREKDRTTGVCNLFIHKLKIILHIFMKKLKKEANTSNQ